MDQDNQSASPRSDPRQDQPEPGRLALEWGRLKFERQKASIETLLKRRELRAAKPRQWKDLLANPLALAIVGGFITLMTTTITGRISAMDSINAEKTKASEALQADLIKKFIDNTDPQKVRANLQFLIEVGLVGDYASKLKSFLDRHPDNSALPSSAAVGPNNLQDVHTDNDAIDLVIRLQGGYYEDPSDPDRAEKFGITKDTLKAYGRHSVSNDDVRNLSVQTAREIYRALYATGSWSAILSVQVKAVYLYFAAMTGAMHATNVFYKATSKIDKTSQPEDGFLGPELVSRINGIPADPFIETADCEQVKYYEGLSAFNVFGRQWISQVRVFSPLTLKGVCPELSANGASAQTAQSK